MDQNWEITQVLEAIDERITERVTLAELAQISHFSTYHFSRLFHQAMGMPVMEYVTRRKVQHALQDLSRGERVFDVALKYGYETHAGFTKAFKKSLGYPPSFYRIHGRHPQVQISRLKGEIQMQPQIRMLGPLVVVGVASRHQMPDTRYTHDIPAFWDQIQMEYGEPLV